MTLTSTARPLAAGDRTFDTDAAAAIANLLGVDPEPMLAEIAHIEPVASWLGVVGAQHVQLAVGLRA